MKNVLGMGRPQVVFYCIYRLRLWLVHELTPLSRVLLFETLIIRSGRQETSRLLRNPKVLYLLNKSPPPVKSWLVHYANIALYTVSCLRYIWYRPTRRFGSYLYSRLQVIDCHCPGIFLAVILKLVATAGIENGAFEYFASTLIATILRIKEIENPSV
jgi:hypothetical protein